jgi:acetyl-CoA C-acetyltransferase
MKNFNPYSRGISIIGVGCTPFMQVTENPKYEGLTEGELYGAAAIEAMEDAGIDASQLDYFVHGSALPMQSSENITPAVPVKEWLGMANAACHHHSEACGTGYVALEQGCLAVASGKYDVVLTGCVEMGNSLPIPDHPAHFRRNWGFDEFNTATYNCYDRAYTKDLVGMGGAQADLSLKKYARDHGLTDSQMDDALNACSLIMRHNAEKNPKAVHRELFEDIAKEMGFDDVFEYLRSGYNPKLSPYLRITGMVERTEGAACAIIVPTKMVKEFPNAKPVEVVGNGHAVVDYRIPYNETVGSVRAAQQAYNSTGIKPDDIDLLFTNDFFIQATLQSPEWVGYVPEGQSWKYAMDGRYGIDGDKPMNTSGGRCSFGHAHAASGLADVYEAVKQIRGEAGDHQCTKTINTALLRGYGGGQNFTANILRAMD